MTILSLMKMAKVLRKGRKTLWKKDKLLVTSNLSFSHNVYKRLVMQTHKNQGLFRKGVINGIPPPTGCEYGDHWKEYCEMNVKPPKVAATCEKFSSQCCASCEKYLKTGHPGKPIC